MSSMNGVCGHCGNAKLFHAAWANVKNGAPELACPTGSPSNRWAKTTFIAAAAAPQPFKSIDEIKVGMRVVPVGEQWSNRGPGIIINTRDAGRDFCIAHDSWVGKESTFAWYCSQEYWAPESPAVSPATLRSPLASDDSERAAIFNFFKTPLGDNTCAKCGAPKGCKYHE